MCSSCYTIHLSSVTVGILLILVKCKILSLWVTVCIHPDLWVPGTYPLFSLQFQTGWLLLFRLQVNWPLCSAVQPSHWTLHFLLRCQFWRWLLFPSYLLFEYHTKQWWLASTIINTVDPKRRTGYCFNSCFMFPLFFLPNVPACVCYHFCRFENFLQSFF